MNCTAGKSIPYLLYTGMTLPGIVPQHKLFQNTTLPSCPPFLHGSSYDVIFPIKSANTSSTSPLPGTDPSPHLYNDGYVAVSLAASRR